MGPVRTIKAVNTEIFSRSANLMIADGTAAGTPKRGENEFSNAVS